MPKDPAREAHFPAIEKRYGPFELGRQGALLALDRLENPNRKPAHIVMQAELVDRGSSFMIK